MLNPNNNISNIKKKSIQSGRRNKVVPIVTGVTCRAGCSVVSDLPA